VNGSLEHQLFYFFYFKQVFTDTKGIQKINLMLRNPVNNFVVPFASHSGKALWRTDLAFVPG